MGYALDCFVHGNEPLGSMILVCKLCIRGHFVFAVSSVDYRMGEWGLN